MIDLIKYQRGLGFLHKYFIRSGNAPTGDAGETSFKTHYSDNQIVTLGAYAEGMTENQLQNVISQGLSNFPTGQPTTADFATYFNNIASEISYTDVAVKGLEDTAVGVAKATAGIAAIGGASYLLWLGIPALILFMNRGRK